MSKLTITDDQEQVILDLELPVEQAFSLGVQDEAFNPVLDGLPLYNEPEVQAVKQGVKDPFKSLIAAMMVALNLKRALPTGLTTTVIIAKITNGGSNGLLTFEDGLLVSKVDPS